MVDALETALASNVGVAEIVVDGEKVRYDRAQAMAELRYWKRQVARSNGRRPVVGQIRLDSAW